MKRSKTKKYILRLLLILSISFIYSAIKIRNYAQNYHEQRSDMAIVLGAGTSNGNLSKVYIERVRHAINLYNSKKIKTIILTGGLRKGKSISDSKAAKNYVIKKGVPSDKIFIEEESTITFYNLKYSKEIMDNNHLSSALLVSDPYHMKRSMQMCNLFKINALPSPTPTSMYRSRKTKFNFLIRETLFYWGYLLIGQYRNSDISQKTI